MITTELMGGLGNQMFQIFNLISYCLDNNNLFVLEKKPILYGPIRNYNVYWDNIFKGIDKHCKSDIKFNFPIWKENGFEYKKIPSFDVSKKVKLYGYFQSYKYFDHNINEIKKILNLDQLKENITKKKELDYSNTISIHFRVGDYAKLQHVHPLMKPDYYIKSLNKIIEKTQQKEWTVLVFCEKEDLAYVNLKLEEIKSQHGDLTFLICDHNSQDWEQMLEMSLCKHNIIANSTFSWWSGYLNSNKDKVVCIPEKWFGEKSSHNTEDLYLLGWEKI